LIQVGGALDGSIEEERKYSTQGGKSQIIGFAVDEAQKS
jgi:hypothetical protein